MSDKHTPEKIKKGSSYSIWGDGIIQGYVVSEAVADRMVASWNFCAGATNEELEGSSYAELKAERDKLKAELEALRSEAVKPSDPTTHVHIPRPSPTSKPKKVVPPEGCASWLTPGKVYNPTDSKGSIFYLIDDEGEHLFCYLEHSGHLNSQNWIVIEWEE